MSSLLRNLAILTLVLPISVNAVERTFTADDGFVLHGDYFQPKSTSSTGVLMMHQCNFNRTMYEDIGTELAARSVHAVSIDFRGFGDSVSDEFNVEKLDQLPEEQQGKAFSQMSQHWPSDVKVALQFLTQQLGESGKVGVIGASCGGSLAVKLSESEKFDAVALFSSAQGAKNIERYTKHLSNAPTLLIAAEQDTHAFTSASELFTHSDSPASKFIHYKGDNHGYPLYEQDPSLAISIVEWFVSSL
ncbi:dienelactone hydrolase family protein [Alteromonas facilis]|uniref:dienelactone hydrolase family protein n=1 Tax=Alteromonas facilis TaxID=2048004 RepID=UPI000C2886CE|nr:alpha/beta hydrolase [Alteromonas facilis]